jgi:hypothetical protein
MGHIPIKVDRYAKNFAYHRIGTNSQFAGLICFAIGKSCCPTDSLRHITIFAGGYMANFDLAFSETMKIGGYVNARKTLVEKPTRALHVR